MSELDFIVGTIHSKGNMFVWDEKIKLATADSKPNIGPMVWSICLH